MPEPVSVVDVPSLRTLVVAATTAWSRLPTVWPELSGEVWACLRAGGISSGCRNVMLYLDDRPRLEIGVLYSAAVPLSGRVTRSALPAGRVARAVHRGPYAGLGMTHQTVLDRCAALGLPVTRTRWEVYGPHRDDPALLEVEVSWLLAAG